MDKIDSRMLPVDALNERRRRAVKMRMDGTSLKDTAAVCEMSRATVIAAVKAHEAGGWKAVDVDRGGRLRPRNSLRWLIGLIAFARDPYHWLNDADLVRRALLMGAVLWFSKGGRATLRIALEALAVSRCRRRDDAARLRG